LPEHNSFHEIYGQAQVCAETLKRAPERLKRLRALLSGNYSSIVMTGCGSSQHLAKLAGWYWREVLGAESIALPASELLQRPRHFLKDDSRPLVFAISRTGGTSETRLAVETLRDRYEATTIAITGEPDTPIGRVCDLELAFDESREKSVAMTQAFTSILYGLCLLADGMAGGIDAALLNQVPEILSRQLGETETIVRPFAEDLSLTRFIYLGSGALWPTASEAALKMTEMALETAVEHRTLEFRHGPKAILDRAALVTIFPTEADEPYLTVLLNEVLATDARVLFVGESPVSHERIQVLNTRVDLPERLKPIAFAHIGQELAYWRAVARGCNPDVSRHLVRTVMLQSPTA